MVQYKKTFISAFSGGIIGGIVAAISTLLPFNFFDTMLAAVALGAIVGIMIDLVQKR
ncbi:MAG: hypothetical protein ACOCWQ_03050 [Nanoarchaeota archaeon]